MRWLNTFKLPKTSPVALTQLSSLVDNDLGDWEPSQTILWTVKTSLYRDVRLLMCSKILLSKQEISNNVSLKDGRGGRHVTGPPWELGRGVKGSSQNEVGRKGSLWHLSLAPAICRQKAIWDGDGGGGGGGYLWQRRGSHTDRQPSRAASPAALETDTGERVHSSSRINLWTTFKVFIEVPRGD